METSLTAQSPGIVFSKEEQIITFIQATYPNIDLSPGTALRDLVVKLYAHLETRIQEQIDLALISSSLLEISKNPGIADDTQVERVLSNFNITRGAGSTASGTLRLFFSSGASVVISPDTNFTIGGLLFIVGAVMMAFNLVKTAKSGKLVENEEAEATVTKDLKLAPAKGEYWHRKIERKPFQMMLLAILFVSIGGLVQIIPTMIVKSNIPTIASVKPYTPLELEGRDLYIREGCYNCHSQLIRPLRFETARFGEYSKAGEFVYDHPFQWGSKRTGPDLAREGGNIKIKKSNFWHYQHMIRPKDVSKGSIMPAYVWLKDNDLTTDLIVKKINAMRTLGVPYAKGYENVALKDLQKQANEIATDIINNQPAQILKTVNIKAEIAKLEKKEIVALIAYLQRLGKDAMSTTTVTNFK